MKGEIGNAARAYQKIIRKWIYFTENKDEWKKLPVLGDLKYIEGKVSAEKSAASFRFYNIFSSKQEPLVSTILSEILLDAIYQSALKGFSA
ncbi:hypothetical protein HYT26_02295 [Candidatus Pacearchaeota archaeon]|nr:hypothetical protein [Candidatus Pacearchaeota archaeon]